MRIVQIQVVHIGIDEFAARLDERGHTRGVLVGPILNRRILGQPLRAEHVVPADRLLAVLFQQVGDAQGKIALQILKRFQALVGKTLVAMRTYAPFVFGRLVPADVETRRGKQTADFAEQLVQEGENRLLARAENHAVNAHAIRNDHALVRAAKLGKRGKNRRNVPRQVDFGNDLHAARSGERDRVANLVLRIVCAAGFVEPGKRFALDAPALVIRKMPMQNVQFGARDLFDDPLDLRNGKEMPRAVKQQPAVGVFRRILDRHAGRVSVFRDFKQRRQRPNDARFG